jgi:hypothetical protein
MKAGEVISLQPLSPILEVGAPMVSFRVASAEPCTPMPSEKNPFDCRERFHQGNARTKSAILFYR